MTRKQALTDLLAKVEAGEWVERATTASDAGLSDYVYDMVLAYNGSLDAANTLHEAVLPPNSTWQYYSGDGHCIVGFGPGLTDYDEAHHDNPARAWLIAIIKALIAKETDQ